MFFHFFLMLLLKLMQSNSSSSTRHWESWCSRSCSISRTSICFGWPRRWMTPQLKMTTITNFFSQIWLPEKHALAHNGQISRQILLSIIKKPSIVPSITRKWAMQLPKSETISTELPQAPSGFSWRTSMGRKACFHHADGMGIPLQPQYWGQLGYR